MDYGAWQQRSWTDSACCAAEVELVMVIGKKACCVTEEEAMDYVVGYTVGNDVSARDWQLEWGGSQWLTGKTFDTFAPTGPAIVTKDLVGDVDNLGISCYVNGVPLQDSTTSYLHFKCPFIVSHLSHLMTLQPGDLIFTGTPPGELLSHPNPNTILAWLSMDQITPVTALTRSLIKILEAEHQV